MEYSLTPSTGAQLATVEQLDYSLFDEWEKFIDASPRTVKAYTDNVRRFAEWISAQGITQPTRDTVIAYKRHLAATLKATTVTSYLAAVRIFFEWTDTLPPPKHYPNIAARVKGMRISRNHKRDALKPEACMKLLDTSEQRDGLKGARDYAIITLMLTGALRCVEVVNANVEDFILYDGSPRLYVLGKDRDEKADAVEIPQETEAAIRAYLRIRARAEGRTPSGSAPLFASTAPRNRGERMTTRSISGIVKDAMRGAGYDTPRLTAHSLRHSAVTNAIRAGEDIVSVSRFARHQDISTTMGYVHELENEKNTCADSIARLLFREGGADQRAEGQ